MQIRVISRRQDERGEDEDRSFPVSFTLIVEIISFAWDRKELFAETRLLLWDISKLFKKQAEQVLRNCYDIISRKFVIVFAINQIIDGIITIQNDD